ncbi:MAG: BamA/TamA family outer membrane protein, partial [Alphaproteobacteria bacterium]|nr:BamA/TamA family outer membrane protein [Alphaproteobacteria bacterium]
EIALPVGDVLYLRSTSVYDYYRPFFENWIFHGRASAGIIFDYDDERIAYNDHFFIGGTILRGFKRSGVGPRDLQTDYVLGAKQYIVGTLETQIPLGIPKELGIKGFAFTDFGFLGKTDVQAANVQDEFSFRATYGISFTWKSPFGPVRFDLARPIVEEDYDNAQFFRFRAGTRF